MKIFKIFNIQIKISYLTIFILVFSMFFNYFIQLIILISIILIHELAHACACNYYNINISEIKIFALGGVARFQDNIEKNPKEEVIIALVGPLSNLIMGITTLLIVSQFNIKENYIVGFFLRANMTICLFNLIPILPLDGGRIARGIIGYWLGIKNSTYIIIGLGYCICILSFFIGIYGAFFYNIEYIFISFLSVYVFFCNKKEKEKINFIFAKNLVLKKKSLFSEGVMDVKHIIAMEFMDIKNIFNQFTLEEYYIITVTDETGKVIGKLSESEVIDAIIKYDKYIVLGELISAKQNKI